MKFSGGVYGKLSNESSGDENTEGKMDSVIEKSETVQSIHVIIENESHPHILALPIDVMSPGFIRSG